MASIRFDTLPLELIAQIATSSSAYSILQLTATCHKIRDACYDSLVFKEVIQKSQKTQWRNDCLDIVAIEHRCAKDVSAWARYALADELTVRYRDYIQTSSIQVTQPIEKASASSLLWPTWADRLRAGGGTGLVMTWLPELFILGHPFMHDMFWKSSFLENHAIVANERHVACLTIVVLAAASEEGMLSLERTLASPHHQRKFTHGETMSDFLLVFAWTILQIRNGIRNRMSIWPFNDSARVPHTPPPLLSAIQLQPLSTNYELPLPFSNKFDDWYKAHTEAMAAEQYITTGVWQGYYTYYGSFHLAPAARQFDPPMKNVRFMRDYQHNLEDGSASNQLRLVAEDCHDGHDRFTVKGTVTQRDGDTVFQGRKSYVHNRNYWDWDLRMTPFGLVGFWGRARDEGFRRNGSLWLWKVAE